MRHAILLMIVTLMLGACAHDSADSQASGNSGAIAAESGTSIASTNGEAVYNEHCAGCHETGMLGAPMAGDAADWGTRSKLWDAVLLDHAITGYLEMPAKGGRTNLPDDVVKAAAEYMLRMTFPDMLHDCNPPVCGDQREE